MNGRLGRLSHAFSEAFPAFGREVPSRLRTTTGFCFLVAGAMLVCGTVAHHDASLATYATAFTICNTAITTLFFFPLVQDSGVKRVERIAWLPVILGGIAVLLTAVFQSGFAAGISTMLNVFIAVFFLCGFVYTFNANPLSAVYPALAVGALFVLGFFAPFVLLTGTLLFFAIAIYNKEDATSG